MQQQQQQQFSSSSSSTPQVLRYRRRAESEELEGERREKEREQQRSEEGGSVVISRVTKQEVFASTAAASSTSTASHVTPLSSLPMALAQEIEAQQQQQQQQEQQQQQDHADEAGKTKPVMPSRQSSLKSEGGESSGGGSLHRAAVLASALASADPKGVVSPQHSTEDDAHVAQLRAHPFYHLHVHLKQGYDLAARDSNGSSDPYAKFLVKGKVQHKSKTVYKDLNPVWDEHFVLPVDDPFLPIEMKVRKRKTVFSPKRD